MVIEPLRLLLLKSMSINFIFHHVLSYYNPEKQFLTIEFWFKAKLNLYYASLTLSFLDL